MNNIQCFLPSLCALTCFKHVKLVKLLNLVKIVKPVKTGNPEPSNTDEFSETSVPLNSSEQRDRCAKFILQIVILY